MCDLDFLRWLGFCAHVVTTNKLGRCSQQLLDCFVALLLAVATASPAMLEGRFFIDAAPDRRGGAINYCIGLPPANRFECWHPVFMAVIQPTNELSAWILFVMIAAGLTWFLAGYCIYDTLFTMAGHAGRRQKRSGKSLVRLSKPSYIHHHSS
jgi:hypothetical protein